MSNKISVFPVVDASDAARAELRVPCACLFYTAVGGGGLKRAPAPSMPRGSLLGLYGSIADADPERLAADIISERSRRAFGGVLLDLPPQSGELPALEALSAALSRAGITHFVPLSMHAAAPGAKLLVESAVSGGSLEELLRSLADRFGPRRLCLDTVRACSDFIMPSPAAEGRELSAAELREIMERHSPDPYFSPELCAKYFTYFDGQEHHYVIFDDETTAVKKLSAAAAAGFFCAFLLYSDWGARIPAMINGARD
ncbi:MAG: hypothetical protein IJU78_06225 [Clostridia bacterium]|nr:hypothetical protein [Clostridia bacterium]